MLALLGIAWVLIETGVLMVSENQQPASQTRLGWLGILFEALSPFGSVGLSTGVTRYLTGMGGMVIITFMFIGRIALLLLAVYLARPANRTLVHHPREELALG